MLFQYEIQSKAEYDYLPSSQNLVTSFGADPFFFFLIRFCCPLRQGLILDFTFDYITPLAIFAYVSPAAFSILTGPTPSDGSPWCTCFTSATAIYPREISPIEFDTDWCIIRCTAEKDQPFNKLSGFRRIQIVGCHLYNCSDVAMQSGLWNSSSEIVGIEPE